MRKPKINKAWKSRTCLDCGKKCSTLKSLDEHRQKEHYGILNQVQPQEYSQAQHIHDLQRRLDRLMSTSVDVIQMLMGRIQ
jgi:hypothetical protein